MKTNFLNPEQRIENAKKQIRKEKGFYIHLFVYAAVNSIIILGNLYIGLENIGKAHTYSAAFFWGIGLLAHGLSVFASSIFFGSDWEEIKIRKYMKK